MNAEFLAFVEATINAVGDMISKDEAITAIRREAARLVVGDARQRCGYEFPDGSRCLADVSPPHWHEMLSDGRYGAITPYVQEVGPPDSDGIHRPSAYWDGVHAVVTETARREDETRQDMQPGETTMTIRNTANTGRHPEWRTRRRSPRPAGAEAMKEVNWAQRVREAEDQQTLLDIADEMDAGGLGGVPLATLGWSD